MLKGLGVARKWHRKRRSRGLLEVNEGLHLLAIFWAKDKRHGYTQKIARKEAKGTEDISTSAKSMYRRPVKP